MRYRFFVGARIWGSLGERGYIDTILGKPLSLQLVQKTASRTESLCRSPLSPSYCWRTDVVSSIESTSGLLRDRTRTTIMISHRVLPSVSYEH